MDTEASFTGASMRHRWASFHPWMPMPVVPIRKPFWCLRRGGWTWPSLAAMEFLTLLSASDRATLPTCGGYLYPVVLRTYVVKELCLAMMDHSHRIRGSTWQQLTLFERWSALSWTFDFNGITYFAPPSVVMRDFAIPEDIFQAVLQAFPCMRSDCGRLWPRHEWKRNQQGSPLCGNPLCDNCALVSGAFGQAWNYREFSNLDLLHTRQWMAGRLQGMNTTEPFGHMSYVHLCGEICPFLRHNSGPWAY